MLLIGKIKERLYIGVICKKLLQEKWRLMSYFFSPFFLHTSAVLFMNLTICAFGCDHIEHKPEVCLSILLGGEGGDGLLPL